MILGDVAKRYCLPSVNALPPPLGGGGRFRRSLKRLLFVGTRPPARPLYVRSFAGLDGRLVVWEIPTLDIDMQALGL